MIMKLKNINMIKLKKAYAWCKRNIRWILAAMGVLIAMVVAITIRADKKQIEKLLIESKVLFETYYYLSIRG